MARYDAMTENFEEVTVLDKPALFTPLRIERNTVPLGCHLYEVRHDDDCRGNAVQIAHNISVNHWGSLITRDELAMPDGFMDIEPGSLNYGAGECRSIADFMAKYPRTGRSVSTITVVDAPEITLAEDEKAGDALLHFYRKIGWNGEDILDPCKIRTTKEVYQRLREIMADRCADPVGVGMLMVNRGPGTEEHIPPGKVYLYEGWAAPAEENEGSA